jgi:glyoxylase-like metal-dependent hydrolase (beta-lactamase superfamily II)
MGAALTCGPAASLSAADRMQLGDIEIMSASDGTLVLPTDFFFGELPQEELAEILAQHRLTSGTLEPPCNVTVMRRGSDVVLFDAGSGASFMPSAGALVDSLDALGIAPEDVTHVIFTHAHPDHIWGVLDDFDELVFPEARYMIGQEEWDYWRDPDTVSTIGEARASFAVGAQRRMAAIENRCSFFADGQEVLPGVMAIATFGHTPGHMAFELRQNNEALLIGGDAIGNHHVAFARPEWASGSDQDPDRAALTRASLLDRLAHEQVPLLGFHLPEGGLGRVERKDSGYQFVTEDM